MWCDLARSNRTTKEILLYLASPHIGAGWLCVATTSGGRERTMRPAEQIHPQALAAYLRQEAADLLPYR